MAPRPVAPPPAIVRPGVGVGAARFGTTPDEVAAALGARVEPLDERVLLLVPPRPEVVATLDGGRVVACFSGDDLALDAPEGPVSLAQHVERLEPGLLAAGLPRTRITHAAAGPSRDGEWVAFCGPALAIHFHIGHPHGVWWWDGDPDHCEV